MPMKQMKAEMFLFPALLSATAILMVLPTQVVSASDCGDSSCDSLVKIDGINIGKIAGDKVLNTWDINKILNNDKTKLENVPSANDGVNNDNNDNNDKIKIKDLNVLLDGDDKAPKIEVLPDDGHCC